MIPFQVLLRRTAAQVTLQQPTAGVPTFRRTPAVDHTDHELLTAGTADLWRQLALLPTEGMSDEIVASPPYLDLSFYLKDTP